MWLALGPESSACRELPMTTVGASAQRAHKHRLAVARSGLGSRLQSIPTANLRSGRHDGGADRNVFEHNGVRTDPRIIPDDERAHDYRTHAQLNALPDSCDVLSRPLVPGTDGHVVSDHALVPDDRIPVDHDAVLMHDPNTAPHNGSVVKFYTEPPAGPVMQKDVQGRDRLAGPPRMKRPTKAAQAVGEDRLESRTSPLPQMGFPVLSQEPDEVPEVRLMRSRWRCRNRTLRHVRTRVPRLNPSPVIAACLQSCALPRVNEPGVRMSRCGMGNDRLVVSRGP